MIYIRHTAPGPFQKILATIVGLAVLALGVAFSVVAIPLIALLGLAGVGYFYWKTRALRRAMAQMAPAESNVIEGEAVVIDEPHDTRRIN